MFRLMLLVAVTSLASGLRVDRERDDAAHAD